MGLEEWVREQVRTYHRSIEEKIKFLRRRVREEDVAYFEKIAFSFAEGRCSDAEGAERTVIPLAASLDAARASGKYLEVFLKRREGILKQSLHFWLDYGEALKKFERDVAALEEQHGESRDCRAG